MNSAKPDLLDAAHEALQTLAEAGRSAANASPNSRQFGDAQMAVARATAFDDAMLAALRSRLSELKEITK